MFFVCVAFTSDIICLLFIPVQWLFFAASTYVWVQYVWHTGKIASHSPVWLTGILKNDILLWYLNMPHVERDFIFKLQSRRHVTCILSSALKEFTATVKFFKVDF